MSRIHRRQLVAALALNPLTLMTPSSPADAAQQQRNDDLQKVRLRLREFLLTPPADAKAIASAEEFLKTLHPDGSWADQVYTDTNRENWKAGAHLPRLLGIAKVYYQAGSPWAKREEIRDKIITSLGYWLTTDPRNDNWWHNEIGVPLQVGNLLILMGDDAPADLRQKGTTLMTRAAMDKMTGQNLVWTAQITVMRGVIANQPDVVAGAYDRMWQEVRWAKRGEEGIQRDASFHQHGPLLYSGGYGAGFTGDVARFANYASDTRFALPEEKRAILDAYVLDGQQWMIRGDYWDHFVTGRELIRSGKSAVGMRRPISLLAQEPGPRQKEMAAFAARLNGEPNAPPLSGNRHYWLSDYMAHHRRGYFASTRMFSTRIANTDGLTNGENKTSHHTADGAMYLARTGQEYVGIYPVWNWHQIPGTTVEQNTELVPRQVRRMGTTRFVGGVSDGTYGAAAMDLATGQLQAKKAWFFFDDEIVCLGAGISCPTANTVATTLNQCLLNGPVRTSVDTNTDLPRGEHPLPADWVWHDNIGYIVPRKPVLSPILHVRNDAQTGSLRLLGPGSDAPVTKDVFRAWLDHGAAPQNGDYAYILAPAATAAQTAEKAARLPVEIVSNTATLQAVRHPGLQITAAAAFRAPGEVQAGGLTLGVDKPCLLLARQVGKTLRIVVSNPENMPAVVNVTIGSPKAKTRRVVRFDLPDGWEAGRSVTQEIPAPEENA